MRLFICTIMVLMLSACNMTPGVPIDHRIDNKNIVYGNEQNLFDNQVIYIWLPPAKADKFLQYTQAFDLDVQSYATKYDLINLHSVAQAHFYASARETGGLFETRTGRLNTKNLNDAIVLTIEKIKAENGNNAVVVFLTPYEEIVNVIDGAHTWHNTYQSMWDHSSSSKKKLSALSLIVNYYKAENSVERFQLGLDLEDTRFIATGKYRYLIAHIFDPLTKTKESP